MISKLILFYILKIQQEIDKIVQKYQGQLNLYQQALSEALNKPVTNVFLFYWVRRK